MPRGHCASIRTRPIFIIGGWASPNLPMASTDNAVLTLRRNARLLGREQFVPERIEAPEGLADLGLSEGFLVSHEELRTVQD